MPSFCMIICNELSDSKVLQCIALKKLFYRMNVEVLKLSGLPIQVFKWMSYQRTIEVYNSLFIYTRSWGCTPYYFCLPFCSFISEAVGRVQGSQHFTHALQGQQYLTHILAQTLFFSCLMSSFTLLYHCVYLIHLHIIIPPTIIV